MLRLFLGKEFLVRTSPNIIKSCSYQTLKKEAPKISGTMSEVKAKIIDSLGIEKGYVPIPKSREHLLQYEHKLEDLPARSMQDSFTSAIIPLSTDKGLQEMYTSFLGTVRFGRLLEDMDMFAVWVCHQHVKLPNLPPGEHLPFTFVTILVDRIDLTTERTNALNDVRISGHVSWVGRSSVEVVVWLEQLERGVYRKITRALFLMAARNATNTAAAPVNPVIPADDHEKQILSGGEQRKKGRMIRAAQSIFKMEPTDHEQKLMYDLYKRTNPVDTMDLNKRLLPAGCRWMSDACTISTIASFPEHRNAHNKVFGGFLMRFALETSWTGCCLYSRSRPKFFSMNDVSFEKPVGINSILKATSYIVFTELNYMQCMTIVDVVDSHTGLQSTTNVIYCTLKSSEKVPEILPLTYPETCWYIQGRRKFLNAISDRIADY